MITFSELEKLRKRVANSVIGVELHVTPLDTRKSNDTSAMYFYSFYFKPDHTTTDEEAIMVNVFLRKDPKDEWQLYTLQVTFKVSNNNKETEATPTWDEKISTINGTYLGFEAQFKDQVNRNIAELNTYISDEHNIFRAVPKNILNNFDNGLVNFFGDWLMFKKSNSIANNAIKLENKIKDAASQKSTDVTNTLGITKTVLEAITLPKGTLTVKNIELDGAFRISFV